MCDTKPTDELIFNKNHSLNKRTLEIIVKILRK